MNPEMGLRSYEGHITFALRAFLQFKLQNKGEGIISALGAHVTLEYFFMTLGPLDPCFLLVHTLLPQAHFSPRPLTHACTHRKAITCMTTYISSLYSDYGVPFVSKLD